MPSNPVIKRRSQRLASRRAASLVVSVASKQKRVPCLVLDASKEGFRLRGNLTLRRGETIELIFEEDWGISERCNVVWVGRAGSKHEGEAGLETVRNPQSTPAAGV